jgi:putative FmdB family regulatory protein
MPFYTYVCRECGKKFQLSMTISQHDEKDLHCPKCRGKSVEQQITPFFAKTSKKS